MADFILNDDGTFEMADKPKKRKKTIYEEMDEAWQKDRESKKLSNYFQKGAFEDGWQKGDLLKTVGYSALDALGNATEGSLRAFEGISDWGRNRGADIVDFFGADDYAKKLRERSKEDDTAAIVDAWNHITAGDISGTKSEEEIGRFKNVNENSVFTDKGDQVFQGVGNSLTSIGVGALSGGTLATPSFVMSAAGNAETEALNNGATAGEARLYGAISGAIEYGTEQLFGGLGIAGEKFGLGKGALDDQIANTFTKNMKSSFMKNITTLGIKSLGEGSEEFLAGVGNAIAQKITYMSEEDISKLLKDQNLMDSFVSGMLSSAIMQSPSTIKYTAQGRDINTGLTRTQQQYVNEIAQQRMVEAQRRNAKLNGYEKGKIEDRALTDFQKGRLIDSSRLQQVNLPGISTKDMDLQQSAYKYGLNPNSEAIVTIDTMLKNRDIIGKFDEDLFKGSNENSLWSRKNGVRYVVFNPNASEQAILEELAIHELTHDLMSSENSKDVIENQKIMDYVSKLDGYEEARAKVEELYAEQTKKLKTKEEKTAYIDEEIVADTLGKNIGSQEYIRRLIDDEPSVAKNIYDWVVNKVANKNGVKNEKAYWNNVKNNFEKAYNMSYNNGNKADTRLKKAQDDVLFTQMMKKSRPGVEEKLIVNDYNNYYEIIKDADNGYKILSVTPISKNEDYLKNMQKEWKNANNSRKSTDTNISNVEFGYGNSNVDNVTTEGDETWIQIIDRILEEIESEKSNSTNNYRRSGKNKRELENSSFFNEETRYSLTDNKGKTLTKEQQELFKNSKARDEQGRLLELYHGTVKAGFNEINGHLMLTDKIDIAKDYAGSDLIYDPNNPNANKTPTLSRDGKEMYWKPSQEIINNIEEYTLSDLNSMFDAVDSNNSMYDVISDFDMNTPIKELRGSLDKRQNLIVDEVLESLKDEVISERDKLPIPLYNGEKTNNFAKSEQNRKIYKGYANLTNPLVIDKNGGKVTYDEIQEAKQNGYDGIIAKNTGEGRGNKKGNTYIIFNSNQFKVVDNTKPTTSEDIRYSLSEAPTQDNEGRTLNKEQREWNRGNKAVDEDGDLITMYHGSLDTSFNVFDKTKKGTSSGDEWTDTKLGFFFSDNYNYALYFGDTREFYIKMTNPLDFFNLTDVDKNIFKEHFNQLKEYSDNKEWGKFKEYLANNEEAYDILTRNYDSIMCKGYRSEYIVFEPNQIKNVDNLNPTDDADIRYSLSEDASIEDKINASMTMAEAKKMIQIAFQENRINDWREDGEKYADGDDWLNDVGVDEVASYIDNTHSTILNYTNPLYDKNIGFGEDYYTESILEAYQNGTLTGMPKEQATRLDTSISNDYQDDRFYSPREVQATLELYNKANQRVTKTNSEEVYKARADFIIATHQKGVAEQLGLTQQEVNKKVKAWANYTDKARNLSNQLNENVSLQNRWSGLENSSIVNTISVTNEDLSKMVKEIKGDSGEWQRQYITSTMLALDTHIDYSKLTFEFDQHQALRKEHALGDYNRRTKTIRIGDGYQNTVAHEIGHYIDNKWAEDFGFFDTANMTNGLNFEATTLSDEAKQFNKNFQAFMDDLVKSATLGYGEKTNYYQDRSEVFARFVGKFVEWTKNQATNNRYGYESKYYEDNFTESQFREFVKILQEKAMLDTTMNAEKKHSQRDEGWQSFLDNNFEAKGTKTRLGDIKLPGLTNTIQEEVQKQTSNALLPIANELRELNKNLTKVMNPAEIAQLTPQDASTTPNLPGINRNQVGDGRSSFFDNINNKVNMLNDEQKAAILSSNDVKYYDKVTNKDSLDKAYARLQENGQSESLRWFNKASESADATDVAEGWILLKHYADSGDTNGMVEVAKKLRDMGTKAGQTVQAFNILSRLTPEGMVKYAQSELLEAYDNMVKNKSAKWIEDNRSKFDLQPNEVQFIMDTMREVSTMEDGYDKKFKLAQIQKVLTDKLPPAKGAGMKAWMRISMLFNPKTQVRNVAGNALIAPINAFGDMFASGVDKLVSAKTGVRTTGNTNWKNYAQGMKTGLYQSYNDFKNGVNTRNIEGNRFEVSEGKSFNDNNAIGKALNKVDSLLSFMLDAGDRGFYEASFVNSINNQMVLNNTTEVTQDMIDIATQEALSRTWQDNNEYTKFVMNVRNGLNKLNIGGYGLGDVLIPFAKTPANLTKAIVEYSPVGLIGTINKGIKLNRSLTNGQYSAKTQHEFVQSLGKATAGTMLYILGIALANAGVTTGESDEDKDVSNFMKNTLGVNSYSIKIGDMSFTYDWAQPLAAPLAITANLVQKQKEEASLLENVVSTLDTAGNLLLEQSFMESISTVLNNNEGIATGMQEAILDLPARAIPTFLKQITDLTDGTQRQTFVKDKPIESMFNSMKAKIPGLSYTLDPSVDTMGREIKKYGGKNNLFNVFLNPANVSTENVSESAQEIYRLYKETGETNIMPRVAPYYVNKKGEKIILTTQQRTQYQKVSGAIIEENVANLLGSTAYQNMSDTKKAETINDIVNYSYNIAQMETLGTELSETYETAYEYAQIGDISDFYEFRNSIDDTDADTKRTSIVNYLYNSDLEDNQIANLYGNYYSSDKTLNAMLELRIPMREFIKFNSADIQGQYNSKTGQTISGSKKNATIEYVNTLNLSKAQRAILVKSVYSSHKSNDNDIIRYVNTLPGTANEKKVLLKSIGFDAYDDDVFNYINSQNISKEEKIKKLKELGFTVRDGRVYY